MILDDDIIQETRTDNLVIEPNPLGSLRDPLEFLFLEHYRHRQLCRVLDHLARAPRFEARLTSLSLDFVRYDLALHVIDEEEDLFPLLRRRCEPDDMIEEVLGRLSGEHAKDQDQAKGVRAVLEEALARQAPFDQDPGAENVLRQFAQHQRSHLALENAIVMPLARRRILPHDLAAMSRRLAARRGVVLEAGVD